MSHTDVSQSGPHYVDTTYANKICLELIEADYNVCIRSHVQRGNLINNVKSRMGGLIMDSSLLVCGCSNVPWEVTTPVYPHIFVYIVEWRVIALIPM